MTQRRRMRPEEPSKFCRRLKFVNVEVCGETVPWPCLEFDCMDELQEVLQAQDSAYLSCPHRKHRLLIEMLHHLQGKIEEL